MLKKLTIIFILSLVGGLIGILSGVYEDYKLKSLTIKYVYQSDTLFKNPVFFIEDLYYKVEYEKFVNELNNGDTLKPLKFPLLYLRGGEKIYLRKSSYSGNLIPFYAPRATRPFDNFLTGYINRLYVHDSLPR